MRFNSKIMDIIKKDEVLAEKFKLYKLIYEKNNISKVVPMVKSKIPKMPVTMALAATDWRRGYLSRLGGFFLRKFKNVGFMLECGENS